MHLEPALTDQHLRTLSIIAESEDVLLFDLEAQELALLGMVRDRDGVLQLTRLGRATLRLVQELDG